MTSAQLQFLRECEKGAQAAGHVWPKMAACEAATESRYGTTKLATQYNNLFGCKVHLHETYGSVILPTKEVIQGATVPINASFIIYPSVCDCFTDRMSTLQRLAPDFPHYAAALAAPDPETYVTEVSKSWSTSPTRAATCIAIYNAYNTPNVPNV